MIDVVGVFKAQNGAERSVRDLQVLGLQDVRIDLLSPGASQERLGQVPTAESEPPGMARTVGAVLGGAVGISAGFLLGAVAASLLVPIGSVLTVACLGAAVFGVAGAVGAGLAGERVDRAAQEGLPADELVLYKDALRQGRSVLICEVPDEIEANETRDILKREGAESIDAAARSGLRHLMWEHYQAPRVEARRDPFSRGFEAAVNPEFHGKPWDQVVYLLAERYREWCTDEFRRGFDRGQLRDGIVTQAPLGGLT